MSFIIKEIERLKEIEDKLKVLDKKIARLSFDREEALDNSEHAGDLENFIYDRGKYFDWFKKEKIFGLSKCIDNGCPHYWFLSYGTERQQEKIYEKETEIRKTITAKFDMQIDRLEKERTVIIETVGYQIEAFDGEYGNTYIFNELKSLLDYLLIASKREDTFDE
jgi:hypothetical protein